MAERVTIQDIAGALGLSRNTVSKAINNTGIVAGATREKVLKKAVEMGYKQFSYVNIPGIGISGADTGFMLPPDKNKNEIALFTASFISNSHFVSNMLTIFQRGISDSGYTFTMHCIQEHEIRHLQLPGSYKAEKTAGIICVEVFDSKYCSMLCRLDTPLLFVDSPASVFGEPLKADVLCMDNQSNIHIFVHEMVKRGKKRIGYIGGCVHCQSFTERYLGYRNAMYMCGLSCPEEYCITGNNSTVVNPSPKDCRKYLKSRIQSMVSLPDVFLCANDFIAIDVLLVFKELGISVPKDVWLCGFDDSQESRIISPTLTTIHVHSQIMGLSAVQLLLSRIKDPSLNYRRVYTETSLIYRESTQDSIYKNPF